MKNLELKKIFRNKYAIRVAAGVVTVAVLGTSAGVNLYTVQAENPSAVQKSQAEETLGKALSIGEEDVEAGKEETVYIVANPDGTSKNVIVSEWLKNKDGSSSIEDTSNLKDIQNVKGDETFTQDGDNITWQADGKDIYYQGTIDKELPVTEKVTYFLDGKEMSPEEMAGKSGKATIRFDYTNHEKTTQVVDGKEHEVYVPFTVMTGMVLPESYANVEVVNGKVISDGNKKMVVGMAMPGLKESLGIKDGDLDGELEIPEYVEVTADVENFSLELTMSIIMSDLVGQANLGEGFDLSKLDEDLDTLTDASGQLLDGTEELSKGLNTLKGSMKEFAAGVATLRDGISKYTDGASQLNDGIHTLASSSDTLSDGVGTLNNSAVTLNQGVAKLDETLKAKMTEEEKRSLIKQADDAIDATFQDAETGTEAIKSQASSVFYNSLANNGSAKSQVSSGLKTYTETVLNTVLGQAFGQVAAQGAKNQAMVTYAPGAIEQAVGSVAESVETGTQAATAQQTAGAISNTLAETLTDEALQGLSPDEIRALVAQVCQGAGEAAAGNTEIKAGVLAQVDGKTIAAQAMAGLESQVNAGLQSPESQAQIQATASGLTSSTVASAMGNEELKAGMDATASQIVEGIASGAKDTVGSAVADTAKTAAKAAAETATLTAVSGTKSQISAAINAKDEASGYSLVSGMQALSNGTQTMKDSIPSLAAGISQLTNGAAALVSNNGALIDGAGKLSGATSQIDEGVGKLAEGSEKLMDGMVQFDEEGIQKLLDAYNGDVKELLSKLEAVAEAGKGYQTFTKVADGTKGSVKFILRTEAIKEGGGGIG
jgi:putative membrane protein